MRLVVQRVKKAQVLIAGESVAAIDKGLLALAGFGREDMESGAEEKIKACLRKLPALRIFPDAAHHMNISLSDIEGEILLVSQFTLHADCRKGRRPSFYQACPPDQAKVLYDAACSWMEEILPGKVHFGIFAADMDVKLINWGPVTLLLDSNDF